MIRPVFSFRKVHPAARYLIGACLLLAVSGCALGPPLLTTNPARNTPPPAVILNHVPHFAYRSGQCGPTALAAVLSASGIHTYPAELSGKIYLPGRKGSLQPEIMAACRRHGRIPYRIAPELTDILAELQKGRPVLVLTNLGISVFPVWHYAVVIGYDLARDTLLLNSADNPQEPVKARVFLRTWQRAGWWGIVALSPGQLPARPDSAAFLSAASDMEEIGMPQQARMAYESALLLWPDNPVALFGLGNTAYTLGDRDTAETAFRKLLRLQPENPAAVNNLAVLLGEIGKSAEGLRLVSEALASGCADGQLHDELVRTRNTLLHQIRSESPVSQQDHSHH